MEDGPTETTEDTEMGWGGEGTMGGEGWGKRVPGKGGDGEGALWGSPPRHSLPQCRPAEAGPGSGTAGRSRCGRDSAGPRNPQREATGQNHFKN